MKKNPNHKDNLVALRRIEGQVRGVQGMIENGEVVFIVDLDEEDKPKKSLNKPVQ